MPRYFLSLVLTLSASSAYAKPCAGGESVRVATFNTWGLPAPVAPNRRGRLGALAGFADALGADMMGLQEVWKGARPLVDLPGLLLAPLTRGDSGLGFASQLPAEESKLHHFASGSGFDRLKAKGVLTTNVSVSGTELPVHVTHMQAGDSKRAARVRLSQLDEILELSGDGPAVVMGDLNLYEDRDGESLKRLRDAGFVDAAAGVGELSPTYPGGTERLDRVWVRSGTELCMAARSAEVVQSDLSDHHAVVVDLVIEPS
ncbi:MAG: endonuclease/exonuclease/phosphatase family protein [Proteobacteria bacterium]|nr:endonuclease/exonuclease/phosphatase family protein [Pseudomonadota bacterium]